VEHVLHKAEKEEAANAGSQQTTAPESEYKKGPAEPGPLNEDIKTHPASYGIGGKMQDVSFAQIRSLNQSGPHGNWKGGVRLTSVTPGASADDAQLQKGDTIVTINGHRFDNYKAFRQLLNESNAQGNNEIQFEYLDSDGWNHVGSFDMTKQVKISH
jgi:C-terminal processing protease CtpA/Prc